jgi:hypothetical protein
MQVGNSPKTGNEEKSAISKISVDYFPMIAYTLEP